MQFITQRNLTPNETRNFWYQIESQEGVTWHLLFRVTRNQPKQLMFVVDLETTAKGTTAKWIDWSGKLQSTFLSPRYWIFEND